MSSSFALVDVFVGLDIGKSNHAYAVVGANGEFIERGLAKTDRRSLSALVAKLLKVYPRMIVGAEATSYYHEAIARMFLERGVTIRVINPQLTTTKIMRSSMRSVKTDASDAEGIAQKLREKQGRIGHPFTWDPERRALQDIGRSFAHLLELRQSLKGRVDAALERGLATAYAIDISCLDAEILRAKQHLIQEAHRVFPEEMAIMCAIRGMGEDTSARFLAETMGMERFSDGHALAAFAGLDPRVRQSGTSVHGKGAITKTGSPLLRRTLCWGGRNLVMWNTAFRERFERDVARGKPRGVAYGSIARRLAVVLYVCLTKRIAFDPDQFGLAKSLT